MENLNDNTIRLKAMNVVRDIKHLLDTDRQESAERYIVNLLKQKNGRLSSNR